MLCYTHYTVFFYFRRYNNLSDCVIYHESDFKNCLFYFDCISGCGY
ncbi:MAG: hypothetical protein RLZZ367_6 [Bacteroidota bacterium]|jgi:hypothetical protein